jgi:hypothetical protein
LWLVAFALSGGRRRDAALAPALRLNTGLGPSHIFGARGWRNHRSLPRPLFTDCEPFLDQADDAWTASAPSISCILPLRLRQLRRQRAPYRGLGPPLGGRPTAFPTGSWPPQPFPSRAMTAMASAYQELHCHATGAGPSASTSTSLPTVGLLRSRQCRPRRPSRLELAFRQDLKYFAVTERG